MFYTIEIIQTYSKFNKVSIPYKFVGRRPGDFPYVVAENSLALDLLNWSPSKTIEDICLDSYRYIRNKYSLNEL